MRRWGSGGGGSGGGGILRKASPPRRPQLLVFGYSCKLFRDDERALHIELGRHLIPWMGDDSLKIDRYDARGALGSRELVAAEGCNKSSGWDRLTPEEQRAERLCDEERYRALYCDEDEEEMYREEELKRIHMSNSGRYGQVEFNYDDQSESLQNESKDKEEVLKAEDEEPFIPSPNLVIPEGMVLPETQKLNTIIEKTASFIASQGTQMEILLKAKQSGNPQFDFLSMECPLYAYYNFIVVAIKEGRYKLQEDVKEDKIEEDDYYLHPSLAPLSVESAPSIPSITYKPSADCAYSMLVNQIKGTNDNNAQLKNETEESNSTPSVDTELAPPGTEPIPINTDRLNAEMPMHVDYANIPPELMQLYPMHGYYNYPSMTNQAEITKAPVLYNRDAQGENQTFNDQNVSNANVISNFNIQEKTSKTRDTKFTEEYDSGTNSPKVSSTVLTRLKLTHYYNSDSENDSDNSTGSSNTRTSHSQLIDMPPSDQQVIIDKMASYVARNGNDFEQIVKMKGDPRFSFLDTSHKYNPYYKHKRSFYERINKPEYSKNNDNSMSEYDKDIEDSLTDKRENMEKKVIAPVSFSIKKMKEPEPILPKPALPYESTSEEETENNSCDNQDSSTITFTSNEKNFTPIEKLQPKVEKQPDIVTEKIEIKPDAFEEPKIEIETKLLQKIYQIQPIKEQTLPTIVITNVNLASSVKRKDNDRKESSNKYKTSENVDYDEYNRRRKRKRLRENRNEIASDVITIDEEVDSKTNSECIDLTEECNEDDLDGNKDNMKSNNIQLERKKRAAAFLSSLKAVPAAPIEHHNTLASAMVKTLHTLHKDEKHSPRRKRRRESSSSRKSKKKKSDKRRSCDRYEELDNDRVDAWKQSSREMYKSRAHSRDRHSKKSKRKKSSRDRSPDYYRSRSHKKTKTSSRDSQRSTALIESSLEKMVDEQIKSANSLKSAISRKNDQLLAASLKDLVREARKEMTPSQPIKMAVDIFANDQSNTTCASDNEWEKESNDDKKYKSKSSSSSSSSSEDSAET